MDRLKICEYAIARIESRVRFKKNHKDIGGIEIIFDTPHEKNYHLSMSNHPDFYSHNPVSFQLELKDLPSPKEVISTKEELSFYKVCYILTYKIKKILEQASAHINHMKVSNDNVYVTGLSYCDDIAVEIMKIVSDVYIRNIAENINTDPYYQNSHYHKTIKDSFKYINFDEYHHPSIDIRNTIFDCFSKQTWDDLYKIIVYRKIESRSIINKYNSGDRVQITYQKQTKPYMVEIQKAFCIYDLPNKVKINLQEVKNGFYKFIEKIMDNGLFNNVSYSDKYTLRNQVKELNWK